MNNTATLIPPEQLIIAAKGHHITAADISRALFYANSRMLAMCLYVDKSFATVMLGYAEAFYTLMKWEMDTFDIRSLRLSANLNTSDDYDIAHMLDYFNDWWKESLGCCRVSDMLPKSSVQDVMDLVAWHFSHLPDHVRTSLLPYIAQGPDNLPEMIGLCHQTQTGRELLDMLQIRMMNLRHSSDWLTGLVGPIEEITRAVSSSQALIDRLNTDDSASM
ncbi:hypothetical protein EDB19DRAFT_1915683 [Suillus lakei]|nr:hypothetical protein EDB19DRAFT_1915683 [Suillus lakei]